MKIVNIKKIKTEKSKYKMKQVEEVITISTIEELTQINPHWVQSQQVPPPTFPQW
jgi:hypothetical protein